MSRCYNEKVTYITQSGQYVLDKECNGYVAVNIGDTICRVNNKLLKPPPLPALSGENAGVAGNADEIFVGTNGVLPILFMPPAGVNPLIMLTEKYYV